MRLNKYKDKWKPLGSMTSPDEIESALQRVNEFICNSCNESNKILDSKLNKLRNDYRAFPMWLPDRIAENYYQVINFVKLIQDVISVTATIPDDAIIFTVCYQPQINDYINKLVEHDILEVIKFSVPEDIKYELKFI